MRKVQIRYKLLSLLLTLAMLLTMQEIPAWAATTVSENELEAIGTDTPANPVHHCTKDTDSTGNTDTTD